MYMLAGVQCKSHDTSVHCHYETGNFSLFFFSPPLSLTDSDDEDDGNDKLG